MPKSVNIKRVIQKLLLSQPLDVPVFHEVALQLLRMLDDHTYRIEDVIVLVNKDSVLAMEMLKQANSSYSAGKKPITTIKEAIVRLGSQQIVNLAFTASMATLKSDNPVINNKLKNIWHHSHAVAITSSLLAVQIEHDHKVIEIDADEVYLAGLLHNIGKLHLLKSMDTLITSGILQEDERIISELLEEIHIQQGIKVMRHWNMPEIYTNAVERHVANNWIGESNNHLVAIVRLCCRIHHSTEQVKELSSYDDVSTKVMDELLFLNMDDIETVYNVVRAVAG